MPSAPVSSRAMSRIRSLFSQSASLNVNASLPDDPQSLTSNRQDNLDLIETAISEAEKIVSQPPAQPNWEAVAQSVPSVIAQQTDTLNPLAATAVPKETWQPPVYQDAPVTAPPVSEVPFASQSATEQATSAAAVEVAATGMYQEIEPNASELPVEVEGYLQEVQDHQEQLPQEIVVSGDQVSILPAAAPAMRPVVVLPITPEMEIVGAKKNPHWSIRWLVEWSRKLMKMFTGKIIYRQV